MSYIDDHPTTFNWTPEVRQVIAALQADLPWKTYINTYVWHPPYDEDTGILRDYQYQSFDVWGGGKGITSGKYKGYRGKPLKKRLGNKIYTRLFNGHYGGPPIAWIIWQGQMWVAGEGRQPAPPGAVDSDPGHFAHIHCTYAPF